MRTQVPRTVVGCIVALHQICSFHQSLPSTALQSLQVNLITILWRWQASQCTSSAAYNLFWMPSQVIHWSVRSAHISTSITRQLTLASGGQRTQNSNCRTWRFTDSMAQLLIICLLLFDVLSHRCLRSSFTDATRLVTIGDRAFSMAAAKVWNKLPHDVTVL